LCQWPWVAILVHFKFHLTNNEAVLPLWWKPDIECLYFISISSNQHQTLGFYKGWIVITWNNYDSFGDWHKHCGQMSVHMQKNIRSMVVIKRFWTECWRENIHCFFLKMQTELRKCKLRVASQFNKELV